ncbi:MAG: hypothetical protein Q8Q09_21670 [Deltaproteobacteria bacterium]|nr:hypothetical protein [Deltaproteobacteria bacterium]
MNTRVALGALVLLAAAACRTTSTPVTEPPPARDPVPLEQDAGPVVDAQTTTPSTSEIATDSASGDATSDELAGSPHRDRLVAALRAWSQGTQPVTAVGPRGVTMIEYLEAGPSGHHPERHTQTRLCGSTLQRRMRALRAMATDALGRTDNGADITCDPQHVCHIPGMEYQPSLRFYFDVGDGSQSTLVAVANVSVAALGEPWLTQMEQYVTTAMSSSARGTCSATRR